MDKIQIKTILFLVVLGGILAFIIYGKNIDRQIIINHEIVCGQIINMRAGKGVNVIYKFEYNGRTYEYNESSPSTTYTNYKNGIRVLQIVVEKNNPDHHRILSDPADFNYFEITSLDTLNKHCN